MKWPDAREVTRHVLWLPCSVPARFRLRGLAKIKLPFMAQGFWPLARRERRAYPAHGSVRSEQRSQRPKDQARMGDFILARPLNPATPPVRFHVFIPLALRIKSVLSS